ncbi:MAG TPA: universal stress protein [Polyangiaceae bacterium]|nr:universal stress protein [Polyangiaceae bacterium]HNZ22841.1 universal stress protein [Polyangiaceae bacterium]HOD24319.1 universal stress protein [Polyangiaceae bacterium]HOH03438.1 universal stress protein [Polyangiaceae bacterium]HOR37848.1 universal stress protein [Polyangiaceae bacterium]
MRSNGVLLVPIDLSPGSQTALQAARFLATAYQARLVVMHVVDKAPAIGALRWEAGRNADVSTADAEAEVQQWLATRGFECQDIVVVVGMPGAEVIRKAKELAVDAIVMATHGVTGIQARFLGGTAYQVLRGVRCPVMTVKPPGFGALLFKMWEGIQLFGEKLPPFHDGSVGLPPKHVLHPTDFSDASHQATLLAARMAGHLDAQLTLLHVCPDTDTVQDRLETLALQAEAMGARPPRLHTRHGDPASEILREAKDCNADLIVMGSQGIGGLNVFSLGSTAARVVRQASCPVVTWRADDSLEKIDQAFRKVYSSLSVASLRAPDEDPAEAAGLFRHHGTEYYLGYYTRSGFVHVLEQYGIFGLLRDRGYDPKVSFDLSDPFEHVLRIHDAGIEDRDHLLIEVALRPSVIELPGQNPPQHFDVLLVLWLCLQDPRGSFSLRKPPMPDQSYPGLGLAREMMELLVLMAERLGKRALVNRPMNLHNARYYHHKFHFLDPRMEGRLAAILRDTEDTSLADASWAMQLGCVVDTHSGEPFRWEGKEQVFPMCDELRAYFDDIEYRRQVWATAREKHYEIDWEQFRQRIQDPSVMASLTTSGCCNAR